jgi:uncharacterized membrane protein YfcA
MPKQFIQDSKIVLGSISNSTPMVSFLVAGVGLSFLVAEGAVLSARGVPGIAYALTAVFIASTVSSIAGFAFSALSGALLFHLIDDQVYVVRVMIVCSIAIQLLGVATLWRTINWRCLGVFLIGGFLGVPAGVYLLLHLPGATYRGVIGTLLIAYGCYVLLRPRVRTLQLGAVSDVCAGFLGGITGGLAGFPGCFVTIWCGLKGWDKARQRGVYQPFILLMQPVTLLAIHLMREPSQSSAQLDWKVYVFIPAALLGAWFGLGIFKRLSDRQFELVVNALLIASGIGLVL